MTHTIFAAIRTALKNDPASARNGLANMGLPLTAIDRIASMDDETLDEMVAKNVIRLNVDLCTLMQLRTLPDLIAEYIRRGASNDLMMTLLGVSPREIALQRAALGVPAALGRGSSVDQYSRERVRTLWQTLTDTRRADRLLMIADQFPMWSLTAIYGAIK